MSRSLPNVPNLDHLKREAKTLLKRHRRGDSSVFPVLRHVPRLRGASDEAIRDSSISLQEVQHALAVDYGFRGWKALSDEVSRRVAAEAGALDKLKREMRDPSVKVRMRALRACAIRIHPNWRGQAGFGWCLACKAPVVPSTIRMVSTLLNDPNWRVRREVVCALAAYAHLGNSRVNQALQSALGDRAHVVRHAAARALSTTCPGCGGSPSLSAYAPDPA